MLADGYPAYITSAGWLGYPDELLRAKAGEALAEGWKDLKIKVGRDVEAGDQVGERVPVVVRDRHHVDLVKHRRTPP